MARYKVGMVFDPRYLQQLYELNKNNCKNKIYQVYGSVVKDSKYTARPSYRLPNISDEELSWYVRELRSIGIELAYTMNTSYICKQYGSEIFKKEFKERVKYLVSIGINRYIVASPFFANLIREINPHIKIEVSTIAHIDTITQIKMWHDRYCIDSVCMNLLKNREVSFIKNSVNYCKENDINVELIVNEFCGNGINNSSTHCIFRDQCYLLHSEGYTESECEQNGYPILECRASRDKAINWLKLNYIRPEDIYRYEEIGVDNFKITGRTGKRLHSIKIIEAYMKEKMQGNLLDLWGHFESEKNKGNIPDIYIDNAKLEGFVEYWFHNEGMRCSEQVCGKTCNYCDYYWDKLRVQSH